MTFTSDVLKAFHDVHSTIAAVDVKQAFARFVETEFGLELGMGQLFPGLGFENTMIGLLHLIGTASQNVMIDIAKIFEAAGAMSQFWDFLSSSVTDIGLKAKESSQVRTVRNWLPRGATGQWVWWATKESSHFLLYKSPVRMTNEETDDECQRHHIRGWRPSLSVEIKRQLLIDYAALRSGLPVAVAAPLMEALYFWGRITSVCAREPATRGDWLQYVEDVSHYDAECHTWQSLWVALCGGSGVCLKPTQLNIFFGTCLHLHRLAQAGLAYSEVPDDPIEALHRINKTFLPLHQLYRQLCGENNYVRTGGVSAKAKVYNEADLTADSDRKHGSDGRRRLNEGGALLECLFRGQMAQNRYLQRVFTSVQKKYHGYSDTSSAAPGPTTHPPDINASSSYGIDYEHRFEVRAAQATGSPPPEYVTIKTVVVGNSRLDETDKVIIEMRFCYGTKTIKLVKTDSIKNAKKEDGGRMMWQWHMLHLCKVFIPEAGDDDMCQVKLLFCCKLWFLSRRYSLGPNAWRPDFPPGFLASLQTVSAITMTCSIDKFRNAIALLCPMNQFLIQVRDQITTRTWATSYSSPTLMALLPDIDVTTIDNQSRVREYIYTIDKN